MSGTSSDAGTRTTASAAGATGQSSAPMVDAVAVSKSFGSNEVLKSITLSVQRGEVMCVIGPSGSGKSTFLRCINHLERIDAGRLYVDGELVGYRQKGGKLRGEPCGAHHAAAGIDHRHAGDAVFPHGRQRLPERAFGKALHGEIGFTAAIEMDDPGALATALADLLDAHGSWSERRAAARAFVERERNWASNISVYAPVYQRLTGQDI